MTSVRGSPAQVLEQVVARHVGLVADRHERREADVQLARVFEDREAERAALGRHRDAAGGGCRWSERDVQPHAGVGVDHAETVRADETDAGLAHGGQQFLFAVAAGGADLPEPRANHDERSYALGDAVPGRRQDAVGWNAHDRKIDGPGNIAHAAIGGHAVDLVRGRVHHGHAAGEPHGDQVVQDLRSNLAARAVGADHGNGAGFEERAKGRAIQNDVPRHKELTWSKPRAETEAVRADRQGT